MEHRTASQTRRDLVVIGAGAVGLACAWEAARAGLDVTVLERDEPGAGASGVAAGMLAPVTEADFGDEELLALNVEGRARWSEFARDLEATTGLPSGYADSGCLVVAADRDDAEELRRLHGLHERLGLSSEWLTPSAARRMEPGLSPRIGGAIHTPDDGHVVPAQVVRALVVALNAEGGELRAGARVESLAEDEAGRVTGVRLESGEAIAAGAVLMAAGAWSAALVPQTEVRPVKGQLLELHARTGLPAPAERVLRTPRCYIVPRGDGTVVVGATTEERGFDTAVTADGVYRLLEAAIEVLPDIAELELTRARAGLRPGTPRNQPLIGESDREGLLLATGHGRNGVLLAPLTAVRVREALERQTVVAR